MVELRTASNNRRTGPPSEPDAFEPEWLTLKEVCERAKVSDATVRRAIKSRRLRAHQFMHGGRYRVRYTDFQAWMSGVDARAVR